MGKNEKVRGVGTKIKLVKESLGLSLKSIGQATGMTAGSIGRFINGQMDPKKEWVDRFCESYHVEKEWMLHGSGAPRFTKEIEKEKSTVGERLAALREEKGLSRQNMADLLGITDAAYRNIERGIRGLTEKNAQKIEKELDVGAPWLLYGDEEKKDYPVSQEMIAYLWSDEEERKRLWTELAADEMDG